ncbi:VOC family protein [Planococcus shenhongbingii]|uniref:VOC family protein n=1 Tax=Planococcus shenhongbingii TaxID=3058398 RepID=A0ABT8NFM7_9BACL|nr:MULTISPECIES: VOC family protein [unclassified Planococcus (in: firmicutes)]MDN7246677.1 VOC family protein [Planococcus sp. N017]WKA58963.1 VOC family protein [Planococcus sp. N016]
MNFHEKPVTYVGEVGLKVLNLKDMTNFYKDIIGLEVIDETENTAVLGAGGNALLKLEAIDGLIPKRGRYAGLYHLAILLPNRKELAKSLIHLHNQGIRLGSSDHLVSEALYLSDPEGNGIEIYRDREPEEWNWNGGQVDMAVDPIDAEGLLQTAQEAGEAWQGMPAGTVMGHIHLHVSNLQEAQKFYVDGLGFEIVTSMGGQALFIADQKYHHHIGLNVWNGVGIPALPEKEAGLHYYTLVLENAEKRSRLAEHLQAMGAEIIEHPDYLETKDPSGNLIRLTV